MVSFIIDIVLKDDEVTEEVNLWAKKKTNDLIENVIPWSKNNNLILQK